MLLPMRGMIRWVRKMKGCRSIKLFGFGAGRLSLAWGRYLIHMVYIKAVGGLNCTLGIEGLIQKYIRISVDLSLGENGAKLFASKVEFRLLEVQSKKQRLRRHLKSMIWLPEKRLSSKCWEGRREGGACAVWLTSPLWEHCNHAPVSEWRDAVQSVKGRMQFLQE